MSGLCLKNITVRFSGLASPALAISGMRVASGEGLAISGPSGCGKTTFVNLVSGLNSPLTGTVRWGETDIYRLQERRRDQWRGRHIGLVMQDFHLFPGLSALENVLLPLRLCGCMRRDDRRRAAGLLDRVALPGVDRDIRAMSRGEMQRIAIARALIRRPAVLIADEPTAHLDPENGRRVADLLLQLAAEEKTTLLVITHDDDFSARLPRQLRLRSGQIIADKRDVA